VVITPKPGPKGELPTPSSRKAQTDAQGVGGRSRAEMIVLQGGGGVLGRERAPLEGTPQELKRNKSEGEQSRSKCGGRHGT